MFDSNFDSVFDDDLDKSLDQMIKSLNKIFTAFADGSLQAHRRVLLKLTDLINTSPSQLSDEEWKYFEAGCKMAADFLRNLPRLMEDGTIEQEEVVGLTSMFIIPLMLKGEKSVETMRNSVEEARNAFQALH